MLIVTNVLHDWYSMTDGGSSLFPRNEPTSGLSYHRFIARDLNEEPWLKLSQFEWIQRSGK